MSWRDKTYDQKLTATNMIDTACSTQNVEMLKQHLPTCKDLLEYRNMFNGGSIFHTLMYSSNVGDKNTNPANFYHEIISAYGLDLPANSKIKEELLSIRNSSGKLAADFKYAYNYLSPKSRQAWEDVRGHDISNIEDVNDTRSDFEKNKIELYRLLKEEIKNSKSLQKEIPDAHKIINPYTNASNEYFDAFENGTPLSQGMYLLGKDPEGRTKPAFYALGSRKEIYPEIRLRNDLGRETEKTYVLRGLDPNSSESLLSQAIDKLDFPEDCTKHFSALNTFEKAYKHLKQHKALDATYRYFNQNRGVVVFEDKQDSSAHGNGNSKGYGGYFSAKTAQENDKDVPYPFVVIDTNSYQYKTIREDLADDWHRNENPLYHELFHSIDLFGQHNFSDMPIFQYGMMLAETDKNNKIKDPFMIVNNCYPAQYYNMEMAAQLMGIAFADGLKDSPILQKIHKLGQYFSIAKCDNNKSALSTLIRANDKLDGFDFRHEYTKFMANKVKKQPCQTIDEKKRQSMELWYMSVLDNTIKKMENDLKITQKRNDQFLSREGGKVN